jgi:hypothetical protein
MKSLAKAYKRLKRESDGFNLTKDQFVIYVSFLFPMFKTEMLKLPIKRRVTLVATDTKGLADLSPKTDYVEIKFRDLWDYLNKRIIVLQRKI